MSARGRLPSVINRAILSNSDRNALLITVREGDRNALLITVREGDRNRHAQAGICSGGIGQR